MKISSLLRMVLARIFGKTESVKVLNAREEGVILPYTEIKYGKNIIEILMDIPGAQHESIKAEVRNRTLYISGKSIIGDFYREINLSFTPDGASGFYRNGVLVIIVWRKNKPSQVLNRYKGISETALN